MYGIFANIYQQKSAVHVGKYTNHMDPMDGNLPFFGTTTCRSFTTQPASLPSKVGSCNWSPESRFAVSARKTKSS